MFDPAMASLGGVSRDATDDVLDLRLSREQA